MRVFVIARISKLTFKSLSSMLKSSKFLVQGLPSEVLGKLLEIIYFSIFIVWQFQFIVFLVISEIIKLNRKIN